MNHPSEFGFHAADRHLQSTTVAVDDDLDLHAGPTSLLGNLRQSSSTVLYQELLASLKELDDEVDELVATEEDVALVDPHAGLAASYTHGDDEEAILDQLLNPPPEAVTTPEVSDPSGDTTGELEAPTSAPQNHPSPTSFVWKGCEALQSTQSLNLPKVGPTPHAAEATAAVAATAGKDSNLGAVQTITSLSARMEWRCIDCTHEVDCALCVAPPPVQDERKWVLLGDQNWKNGEKKLRSLLQKTREWRSVEEREALAAALEEAIPSQTDDGAEYYYPKTQWNALVHALRKRDLTALRKTHLLLMCREWKFKSDVWSPRAKRSGPLSLKLQNSHAPHSGEQGLSKELSDSGRRKRSAAEHQTVAEADLTSLSSSDPNAVGESEEDRIVVRDLGAGFMSGSMRCMGNDLEETNEEDYRVLSEKRKELFDVILPKVKESIEVVVAQPDVVACMVGVDSGLGEAAFLMQAEQSGLREIVDECITYGHNVPLAKADPVHDMDSLRRCYNLVRLALLEAINTERVRLLLATSKEDLMPEGDTPSKLAQYDHCGYPLVKHDYKGLDICQVTAGTFGLIKAQCSLYIYIMTKVPEYTPPEVLPFIQQHALINRTCVHYLEAVLADTATKTSNFEVVRQVTVIVLDMLALTQCSKDQIRHRKSKQKLSS